MAEVALDPDGLAEVEVDEEVAEVASVLDDVAVELVPEVPPVLLEASALAWARMKGSVTTSSWHSFGSSHIEQSEPAHPL